MSNLPFFLVVLLGCIFCLEPVEAAGVAPKANAAAPSPPGGKSGAKSKNPRLEQPDAELTVTVNGVKVALNCGPDGAKVEGRRKKAKAASSVEVHPREEGACGQLASVTDLETQLKPLPSGYDPCVEPEGRSTSARARARVRVQIEGTFRGKVVSYSRKFRNKCQVAGIAQELFDVHNEGPGPEARMLSWYVPQGGAGYGWGG